MALLVNFLLVISLGSNGVLGSPFFDDLMHEQGDDTAVVESVVREARAVGPSHIGELLGPGVKDAYLHTFGDKDSDEGDLQGYSKKSNDKGNDGYKHFDSFHKKDSDKFGYEVHSEFGKANKASVAVPSGKDEKYVEHEKEHSEEEDDGEETKHYQVTEDLDGNKKKKAVEAYDGGYDGDSGESSKYSDGDGESKSEGYESSSSYAEGDDDAGEGQSGHYTAASGSGADDYGESEGYAEAEDEEENDY